MIRYFYMRADSLSDRGYNIAIEVYRLNPKGYPTFVGGNYRIQSASWRGEKPEARLILAEECGHKLDSCYKDFPAKSVELRDMLGN